jgi:hypothetical protein
MLALLPKRMGSSAIVPQVRVNDPRSLMRVMPESTRLTCPISLSCKPMA